MAIEDQCEDISTFLTSIAERGLKKKTSPKTKDPKHQTQKKNQTMSCCNYTHTHGVHDYKCPSVTENLCRCGARRYRLHNRGCVHYYEPCDPSDTKNHPGCKFLYVYSAKLRDPKGDKLKRMLSGIVQWQNTKWLEDLAASNQEVRDAKIWEYPKLFRGRALRIGEYVFFAKYNFEVGWELYDTDNPNHTDLVDKATIGDWKSI
jgi:hypothetical protein